MDCEKVTRNIRKGLRDYIVENKIKSLVIGVSGGADSACVCALARPVCDELSIPLIGRSIPIESNKPEEIERARLIGISFCHELSETDYTALYQCMVDFFEGPEGTLDAVARGNIKARIRMQYLYTIAGKRKGLVLSTDNLTEYYLGFFTLCGDVGDYAMIQHLWKTEVYMLMSYLAEKEQNFDCRKGLSQCKMAVPTDGLGISESDLDQIKARSYDEVEIILKTWLTEDSDAYHWDDWLKWDINKMEHMYYEYERPEDYDEFVKFREQFKDHPVVQRYERTHFKRRWPIVFKRDKIFSD